MRDNPMSTFSDFERPVFSQLTSAIRAIAMDAVQQAGSGHPGMPIGMAEIAEVLWNHHLRHNPVNPRWPNRDRFVLSNGHGSLLLYALLHLTGYDLSMEDLKQFRQLHSKTPGHPEYGLTPGVETTTGPLGQGLTNAVGMALAEKLLAAAFNRPGLNSDDTPKRFEAYGWHVVAGVDGHDSDAVDLALRAAREVTDRPSLICCKTVIGMGSPNKANTGAVHGAALGEAEVAATRKNIGWDHPPFEIPQAIYQAWDARPQGARLQKEWSQLFAKYRKQHPELAAEFLRRLGGTLPAEFHERVEALVTKTREKAENIASRKASHNAIEGLAPVLPELIGGSADLAGSNLTLWSGSKAVTRTEAGNYVFYGVREFGMSAIMNGLALHGGFNPYGGTFLTFSDYSRNALRMAALMKIRTIFVFTHESIGLGEDGPTHQSVEHTASLRLIPGLDVWRPCDSKESLIAWSAAIERHAPSCLLFSRQNLPFQTRTAEATRNITRGGYVLSEAGGKPSAVIIATGSEVQLAMGAQKVLAEQGIAVRVVSMPSTSVFDRQDASYRESVLPKGVRRIAVEAGVSDIWRKYVGLEGAVLGIDRFGESAQAGDLFKYFGFTVDNLVAQVKRVP